jgi:hypothetical protein
VLLPRGQRRLTPARGDLRGLLSNAEALEFRDDKNGSRKSESKFRKSSAASAGATADDRPRNNARRLLFNKEPFDDPNPLADVPRQHHEARVTMRSSSHKAGCAVIRRFVSPKPTPNVLVDSLLVATALTAGGFALLLCAQLP